MHSRTQERVERWDSRPFTGGYDGLRDLAAADFSGGVTVDGAWCFVLNGRIVGTSGDDLAAFETGSGTCYEAPHPSLPLLFAMNEQGGETRGTYYTNETPLREADRTLRDRSFTGYVELSENVVSGDYYVVYYGGRRLAAAYLGASERLLTGEEAFERAADEVGIYDVVDVDLEVTDVPERPDSAATPPADDADVEASTPQPPLESDDVDDPARPVPDADLEREFEREAKWRETDRIPAVDPETGELYEAVDSATPGPNASAPPDRTADRSDEDVGEDDRAPNDERPEEEPTTLERLEADRDRLRSTNHELSTAVEQLRSRVRELESALEAARAADTSDRADSAGTELSRREALSGTNLFVRYDSRSRPTLEAAHGGGADRDDVASNLRLEHHTRFDDSDVVVEDTPYAEALAESMAYRFADWLATALLFEIRDTGHADGLGALYDALPRLDRIELHGSISLADDETADVPDAVEFDLIAYDRTGDPLLVADLDDSREPVSETVLTKLEERASAVEANYPTLAAAVVVTSSYFDPAALDVVERATGGGFLSRGSRLSFVNRSRKQGYHLCLVESRAGEFHVTVPEL